jgi:hypothetical protein
MPPNDRYTKTCFVIMPFGRKKVGRTTVDFDAIYADIFEPAIRAVPLPAPETGVATLEDRLIVFSPAIRGRVAACTTHSTVR